MAEEDLDLDAGHLLSRYPREMFAFSRLGIPFARFASRTGGGLWQASVVDTDAGFRVVNISRIGICLDGPQSLRVDERYSLTLTGPAGESEVGFYVLRCHLLRDEQTGAPFYRMAGLFADLLDRDDLPG